MSDTVMLEVARELLPHLSEWSRPVRIKVESEEDGVVRLILKDADTFSALPPRGTPDGGDA